MSIALDGCNAVKNRAVMIDRTELHTCGAEGIPRSITVECLLQCASTVDISLGVATGSHDPVAFAIPISLVLLLLLHL